MNSSTIETSICITRERKEKIIYAAKIRHVPVRVIMAVLMTKSRSYYRKNNSKLWKAVRYQTVSPQNKYIKWHVSLDPVCYEYGVSERLVFKVSVSLIYQIAVDLFLDTIIRYGLNSQVNEYDLSTNYFSLKYNLRHIQGNCKEFWIIEWNKRKKDRKT